jgi:DNA-binding NarL/FixJ family response regulator
MQKLTAPILVLSTHSEQESSLPALQAGANGFITKERAASKQFLTEALQAVLCGGTYVSQGLTDGMESQRSGIGGTADLLSEQEKRVLYFLAEGHPVKAIAGLMKISEKTVRTYRSRLLEKLNLKSDPDLIRYAIENKLLR